MTFRGSKPSVFAFHDSLLGNFFDESIIVEGLHHTNLSILSASLGKNSSQNRREKFFKINELFFP